MPNQTTALQIANKIHLFLMRELGKGIDVDLMVRRPAYARDVLLVCDACIGSELAQLSQQYRRAVPAAPNSRAGGGGTRPGHAPHGLEWSRDSSGFGITGPLELGLADPARRRPGGWLRRLLRA